MILFQAVVQVRVTTMENLTTENLADGSWIGIMPIGRHAFWRMINRLKRLFEKPFGGIHLPFLTQQGINEIPVPVDGAIEVTPLPVDFDVGFVDVPGGSRLSPSPDTELLCQQRSK